MNFDIKWGKGPTFAEVAETLAVPTSYIVSMAVLSREHIAVLYTPELPENWAETDDVRVMAASLRRDADGILIRFGREVEMPNFWREMREAIERRLERGDDD